MAGSFYSALSGLLAPPLDAAERQARMAELAQSKAPADPPIDAACRKRVAETSVAVVGGGLAGLAAARWLARAGATVTLFEAGKEVGGRARSSVDFSTGRTVEFGAELVGAIHPTWLALAREYELGLIGRSDAAHHAKTGLETRLTLDRPLTLSEQIAVAEEMTKRVLHPIGTLANLINDPARPWSQPGLKKFDSLSVADLLVRTLKITRGSRLWLAMELLLVNDDVAPLDELNLLGLLCLVKGGQFGTADKALMGYWTELEVFRSSEGCQSLALALAHEFETKLQGRLRRQRLVVAIDLAHRPLITSRGFDGHLLPAETAAFDYVVFAVPPSVWSAVKITPVHPMDPGQVGVMNSGPAVKFFSELDRRAWIDSGGAPLGGALGLGQIWESTDQQVRLPGRNLVLAVFAGGRLPAPGSYEPSLEALYPGYRKARVKSYLMDWPNEPHVRTGYASPGKGQIFTVGQALNRPCGERRGLAGAHTRKAYCGYMEGALQSGRSAAQQVLQLVCSESALSKPQPQVHAAELGDEVIGHDDRVRVSDTLTLPARWVCAIDLLVDDPKHGKGAPQIESLSRGTGILIGPSHVLTAAHVFDDASLEVDGGMRKVPVARVRVSPARNGDNTSHPLGAAYSKAVHRPQRYAAGNDYALIVLDRDLSQATHKSMKGPLGYWGQSPQVAALRVLDPGKLGDPTVCVIGYPGDRCGNDVIKGDATELERRIRYCAQRRHDEWASTAWQSSGTAHPRAGTGLMLHDADTYEGQSGGPIYLRRGDTLELLGVHGGEVNAAGGGPPTNNRGARVTIQMLNDLHDWINADAGRTWVEVRNDALVFLPNAAAHGSEHASDAESGTEDDYDNAADVSRIAKVAAKIDDGLRAGEAALTQVEPRGRRELLAFTISLLRTHFFPNSYGIVDATSKVVRASARAIVEMQVEKADGSRWPFEHRVRLSISAKPPDSARWAGEHRGAFFSVITLFVGAFDGVSASAAAGAAVHEIVHMLFAMLGRLRERFGDAVADRFLASDPWRQLDMRPFTKQSDALAAALDDLLKVLRLPVTTAELARSLVEEAFAYTMGREFSRAIEAADAAHKPGPKVVIDAVSIADILVRAYVLERSSVPATALAEPAVAKAVRRLAPAIEALTDAMRGLGHAALGSPLLKVWAQAGLHTKI
jgi:monoamine oxidase